MSATNQYITQQLVDREVYHCVSYLICELTKKAEHFPDYYDELMRLQQGPPPPPDYEAAAREAGWVPVSELCAFGKLRAWYNSTCTQEELTFARVEDGVTQDGADYNDWEELCDMQYIDPEQEDPSEIYEHYSVSDWFGKQMQDRDHGVCEEIMGLTIWGRPTTGQSICIDCAVMDLASDMEILEGQRNDWSKTI